MATTKKNPTPAGQRLAELRRSNAAGKHRDKRDRRRRTRSARKRSHIREDTA